MFEIYIRLSFVFCLFYMFIISLLFLGKENQGNNQQKKKQKMTDKNAFAGRKGLIFFLTRISNCNQDIT